MSIYRADSDQADLYLISDSAYNLSTTTKDITVTNPVTAKGEVARVISDNSVNVNIETGTIYNTYAVSYTTNAVTTDITANVLPGTTNTLVFSADFEVPVNTKLTFSGETPTITSNANTNFGFDFANVSVTHYFNTTTKAFTALGGWSPSSNNDVTSFPKKGDLWMLGEMKNTGDVYTNKAGKLFKVTDITRTDEHEIQVGAMEYVSNVYVDSDTFIDYTPTAYTDITSPLVPPPTPEFVLKPLPRRTADGSVVVDVLVDVFTERQQYHINMSTEYFVSLPDVAQRVINVESVPGTHPATFKLSNTAGLGDSLVPAILTGKSGFSGTTGELRLLCTDIRESDAETGLGSDSHIEMQLEGLNVAFDYNWHKHFLDVNDTVSDDGTRVFPLKGDDFISFPTNEKANTGTAYGFVGHNPRTEQYSAQVLSHNANGKMATAGYYCKQDNVIIRNSSSDDGTKLFSAIPAPPFYVSFNQLLVADNYANNNFYVTGTEITYTKSNTITLQAPVADSSAGLTSHIQPLEIVPRHKGFIKAFVDGTQISSDAFNLHTSSTPANVEFLDLSASHSQIRVVIDHYTVPTIEVGDNVQFLSGNVFSVLATSYDNTQAFASSSNLFLYDPALTANSIYTITLRGDQPKANVGGTTFVNISPDITGSVGNVNITANTFTLDYDKYTYPGSHNLANNGVYTLGLGSPYDQVFLTQDRVLPSVRIGPISVKARNKNTQGRTSPFNVKTIIVEDIPISKVTGVEISEELFIDTNKGVSIRATVAFDHLENEEVTDYEVSYKLTGEASELSSFNTVKVSAAGIDTDGKIRFSITNVNRGSAAGKNTLVVRITPLNKEIRGITAETSHVLQGKTAPPANVSTFSVGQSTDQITITWTLPTPRELDLQDIVVKRMSGSQSITESNWILAGSLVTVSDNINRKSVPIDSYGEFTYFVKTRDTSGNFSSSVLGYTLITSRQVTDVVVAAFSEDSPGTNYAGITNTNQGETNFPSFTKSRTGGNVYAGGGSEFGGLVSLSADNAGGTSDGFSAASSTTDLDAATDAYYVTKFRDMGSNDFYHIESDHQYTQVPKLNYASFKTSIFEDTAEALSSPYTTAMYIKATGIGITLRDTYDTTYDPNNTTLVDYGDYTNANVSNSANVLAVWNEGQYSGNVITVLDITKASPAVITTHYLSNAENLGNTHCISNTSAPGARFIIHDADGMTQINDKELYAKRLTNVTLAIYTDKNLTTALDTSSGYDTYTGGAVVDQGDYANSNSYSYIAEVKTDDVIMLGNAFHANGVAVGSNLLANVGTVTGSKFHIVDLKSYDDVDADATSYEGTPGAITTATEIRTSSAANIWLQNTATGTSGSNGNVNYLALHDNATSNGWSSFEPGTKQFRWIQMKLEVTNSRPDENDFTLDKFNYTISRPKQIFETTIDYTTVPAVVDWSAKNFRSTPYTTINVEDVTTSTTNVFLWVWNSLSTTQGTLRLFKPDGSAAPSGDYVSIQIRAEGA